MRKGDVTIRRLGLVAVLVLVCSACTSGATGTRVGFVFPDAANLIPGGRVEVDGTQVGSIADIEVRDGRAVVWADIEEDQPITSAATAAIEYRALLGERVLRVDPGDAETAMRSGTIVADNLGRVELDQVLNTLTPEVRADLQTVLDRAGLVLDEHGRDANDTLAAAGPTVDALGRILAAIGNDGPALQDLVVELDELASELVTEREALASTVTGLQDAMGSLAGQDRQLAAALDELPTTLSSAEETLEAVTPTVDVARPVVQDLRPVADRLPQVASDLAPLLRDARPLTSELRAATPDLVRTLNSSPALLDELQALLPGLNRAGDALLPAVDFLRPYTPELVGWLSNWGSIGSGYDQNGRYARIWVNAGPGNVNEAPWEEPPLVRRNPYRLPGELEGQPWTDAFGSEVR